MTLKLRAFRKDLASVLPVRGRVTIMVNERIYYYNMECDGLTQMGQGSHLIRLARRPSRGFFEVLAHEWAHLNVDENWLHVQHGPIFQDACHRLAREMKARGWKLSKLYDLKLDKLETRHRVTQRKGVDK